MGQFRYEGFDRSGKRSAGTIEAENEQVARSILKGQGFYLSSIREQIRERPFLRRKINPGDLAVSTRELSTLLNSGLTLDECLTGLTAQMRAGRLRDMYLDIQKKIREGNSFSKAASAYPECFQDIFLSMMRAGEASGNLALVLERIAQFMEERISFKNRLTMIMTYPALMAVVGFFVLIFILTFVAPTITRIFQEISMKLPLPTIVLLGVSAFLRKYILLLIACAALLVFALKRYIATQSGIARVDSLRLRLPLLRDIFLKSEIANFASTLGTLLESGVEILTSFNISRQVVYSPRMKKEIEMVGELVSHGQSISGAMQKTTLFPYTVIQLVSAGEKSGRLPEMLKKIAATYQEEVTRKATRFVTVLEPLMIVFMAVVVGFVVIGIMLPIFQISQSIR